MAWLYNSWIIDRTSNSATSNIRRNGKLDVTLEPSNAPELPKEWRDKIKNLIDVEAHYLEQTWDLMQRKIKDKEN